MNFAPTVPAVALALMCAFATARADDGMPGRPNVLLIVADDLGFSDLGCYGGEISTPNLDTLATEGVRLTRFYTTGRCCPSRASILTGLYPHRAGLGHMVKDLGLPGYRGRPAADAVTIGEALQAAGYRTFMSGKWHLGTDDPTRRGFEEFYGTLVSAHTFWEPAHYRRMPAGRVARSYAGGTFYGTDALTDHAIDFMNLARETPAKPWFLYLAYNAPHFPLHAPAADIARHQEEYAVGWDVIRERRHNRMIELGIAPPDTALTPRSPYTNWAEALHADNPAWDTVAENRRLDLARRMAIYAAMIDVMDRNIGRVIADLATHGELDNTLIVFVSDNGACAEWDPHGFDIRTGPENILHEGADIERMGGPDTYHSVGSGWANASNTPWRLYKHYNHEGGISSPCIVRWPARLNRASAIDDRPGHLIDLMPTVLEAVNAEYPASFNGRATAPLAGVSLLPLLRGEPVGSRSIFFEHEGNRAVADGRWKLSALKDGDWELYDLENDRTELVDRAAAHPEVVKRLSGDWEAWAAANFVTPAPDDFQVPYLKPSR